MRYEWCIVVRARIESRFVVSLSRNKENYQLSSIRELFARYPLPISRRCHFEFLFKPSIFEMSARGAWRLLSNCAVSLCTDDVFQN